MWYFLFKSAFHRYNILDIDEDGKIPDQNFSGVEFQIFPTDCHTWGCPVFNLESPMYVGLAGLPKWEPILNNIIYLVHSPFHAGSVSLVLNTRAGYSSPKYHVVFYDSFYTV